MNKYANQYLKGLVDELQKIQPLNSTDAVTKMAPLGAAIMAPIGGIYGVLKDPGRDEEGRPKSRFWNGVKGALTTGTIGAIGGLAVPTVGNFAAKRYLTSFIDDKLKNIPSSLAPVERSAREVGLNQLKNVYTQIAPQMTVKQIWDMYKFVNQF